MKKVLSFGNRSRVIADLTRAKETDKISFENLRLASVLVPLINGTEPKLLFTVRSRSLRQHRGQVSFPGGLKESEDCSPIHTALRETEEELGIPTGDIDVWGELPSLPDRQRKQLITPVLATIPDSSVETIKMQTSEVDHVFTVPLSVLCKAENRRYTIFKGYPYAFPVYFGGPRRIWGLTGFILDAVLNILLNP